ncbi:hypothetical protein, partial [Paenibacillus elgii]|uniref:hypothetical protein n=1 Tax=Paenibacillus elgii TaxID=189691 RepID=UPI000248CD23
VSQAALRQRGLDPTRVVLLPSDELHALPLGKALQGPGERRRSPKRQRRRYLGSKQAGWAIDHNPVRGRRLKSRKHSRARPRRLAAVGGSLGSGDSVGEAAKGGQAPR